MASFSNEEKLRIVNKHLVKLMSISEKGINKSNYELALSALSTYCNIQYSINQVYTDKKAEDYLLELSNKVVFVPTDYKADSNVVLFYDGFGFDLRGWSVCFARAFSKLNYKVIFVEPLIAKNRIPHIIKELNKKGGIVEYIDYSKSFVHHLSELNRVIIKYKPKTAFFYTTPNDVSAASVFNSYKDKIERIQVDLTDHAFWIGVNAFDYGMVSRIPGASNMIFYRGISQNKVKILDCSPYINNDAVDLPFPFDLEKETYFFSGGALYKTLGDKNLMFYKMVEYILKHHSNIKFLYAGSGDCSELNKLSEKFPNRVFLIDERSDFIRMFNNCIFFLNTYPMFGGLMMRYSALSGKVPLTLKHGNDHEGILFNQSSLGIEFDSFEDAVKEADSLILDENYRRIKENLLKKSVITEDQFSKNLHSLIENGVTDYKFDNICKIDTTEFRREYIVRLKTYKMLLSSIAQKENLVLFPYFPLFFFVKVMYKIHKEIKKLFRCR